MGRSADLNVRISEKDWDEVVAKADALGLTTAAYVRGIVAIPVRSGNRDDLVSPKQGGRRPIVLSVCSRTAFCRFRREVSSWANLISQAERALGSFSMDMYYEPDELLALQGTIDGSLSCAKGLHESFEKCYREHIEPARDCRSRRRDLCKTLHVRVTEEEKAAVAESAQLLGTGVSRYVRNMLALPLECSERIIEARGAGASETPQLVCDAEFIDTAVSEIRDRGRALDRAVHAFNSICLQPAMPYREKKRLFEHAAKELRFIEDSTGELLGVVEDIGRRNVLVWQ